MTVCCTTGPGNPGAPESEGAPMSWELVPESAPNPKRRRGPWGVLLFVGSAIVLLGLALLIWPLFAATGILAFLVGAAFIGNGLAAIVGTGGSPLGAPMGIVLIVLGLIAVIFPAFTVNVLVGFVAVVMLIIGVIWLLIAIRLRGVLSTPFILLPAVVVALGLAAFIWPSFALTLAAVAAGIVTLLIGGSLIAAALAVRRAAE